MEFVGDCGRCTGLCCVALERTRAGGFGADLPAGTACPNLAGDFRCRIHDRLRAEGWPSCTTFDCFGAGQQVVQVTFGGDADWRADPSLRPALLGAFTTLRHVMEVARLLTEARDLATGGLRDEVVALLDEVTATANADAAHLATVDVNALRAQAGPLLGRISEAHRAPLPRPGRLVPRASLMGADLSGAIFCTQQQVDGARGDAATILPPGLRRPSHWA